MRIKLSIAASAFFVLMVVPVVSAQETLQLSPENSTLTATPSPAAARPIMKREATPIQVDEITDQMKNLRTEVIEKRTAAKETAEVRRDALKEKIALMKDMQKKAVLQRLDNRFMTVNDSTTDKWATALEAMVLLTDRIGSQAADLKSTGVDTTALDASVARARTAITVAQTAVTTQAGKTYVMPITTEATVRTSAGTTVTQFRTDLRSTHLTVSNAKLAVRNAVVALKTALQTPKAPTPVASESAPLNNGVDELGE